MTIMVKYHYNKDDFIITNIGTHPEWDTLVQIIIKQFLDKYGSENILVFVPQKYYYQVLYWAWQNDVIEFSDIVSETERLYLGRYIFVKVDSVYGPGFKEIDECYDSDGLKQRGAEWYIACRLEMEHGNVDEYALLVKEDSCSELDFS